MLPLFWLVLAILLIIIELLTFNLVTTWFAVGSIAAMITSLIFPEWLLLQIVVFIVVSVLALLSIRDLIVKKLKSGKVKTNVSSLIGRKGIVTRKIQQFNYGEVKIGGNYWTAKSFDDETIEEQSIVEIVEVSGVKLVVRKIK